MKTGNPNRSKITMVGLENTELEFKVECLEVPQIETYILQNSFVTINLVQINTDNNAAPKIVGNMCIKKADKFLIPLNKLDFEALYEWLASSFSIKKLSYFKFKVNLKDFIKD